MTDFLLRLFGVTIDGALSVVSAGLQFRNGGAGGWVFLLALALGVLAWWTYREHPGELPLKPGRRRHTARRRSGQRPCPRHVRNGAWPVLSRWR